MKTNNKTKSDDDTDDDIHAIARAAVAVFATARIAEAEAFAVFADARSATATAFADYSAAFAVTLDAFARAANATYAVAIEVVASDAAVAAYDKNKNKTTKR